MNDKALHIIKTLQSDNHQALFTGGVPRDLLLKKEPKDWDVVTSATPEQIKALFPRVLTVGQNFGVCVVVIDGTPIDVATFRKDGKYTDGRKPDSVELTNSMEEDSSRRDFTINAMFYDPVKDVIIDFHGGKQDLEKKIIKAVGDPRLRINEDKLRIMRAVRFHACLGFELEETLKAAIKHLNYSLTVHVSPERIRNELVRICDSPHPVSGFKLMKELELLHYVLPEVFYTIGCEQDPIHHPEGDVWTHTLGVVETLRNEGADPLLILAGLLHDIGKVTCKQIRVDDNGVTRISNKGHDTIGSGMAVRRLNALRFPRSFTDKVAKLIQEHMKAHEGHKMKKHKLVSWLRDLKVNEVLEAQILLQHADGVNSAHDDKSLLGFYTESLTLLNNKVSSKCLVDGKDLISVFNLKPGPEFKIILDQVLIAQDEGLLNSKEEAFIYIKDNLLGDKKVYV